MPFGPLWSIIKTGYAKYPEKLRWRGKLRTLYLRHETLVAEMTRRGYSYASPLDRTLASGSAVQDEFIDPPERQRELLRAKGSDCCV